MYFHYIPLRKEKQMHKTDAAEIQRILSGIGFMRQKIRKQFTPP